MSSRIGTFFIVIGISLIALFVISDMAQSPMCQLLLAGVVSLGIGVFLWRRNWAPPQPGTRFVWWRQQRAARAAKKQKKENQPPPQSGGQPT
jgi:hypothetical protein